jgi:hypothetical protein
MNLRNIAVLAAVFAGAAEAGAGTVQFQLGEQDFADGRTPVMSSEIRQAGAGEQYPFDGTIFGHDLQPSLGAFEYTHAFDLHGATALSAMLTIGLIDVDSPADAPAETVGLTFDGVAQPTEPLRGISATGAASSVEVVNIPVPIDLLADGSLTVSVAALRGGFSNVGNAIEPDFSRLIVETAAFVPRPPVDGGGPVGPLPPPIDGGGNPDDGGGDPGPGPTPVPIPGLLWPAGALLVGLATVPKRRLLRWLKR